MTNRQVAATLLQASTQARNTADDLLMRLTPSDVPPGGRTEEVLHQARLRLQQAEGVLKAEALVLMRSPEEF